MKNLIVAASVAVDSVFAISGCAVADRQSTVGDYVDDATVTTRIKAKFAEDQQVSAMRINVETLKGEVQLSGFASSEAEKSRAADLARSVANVKSVRNNIVVRTPEKK